MSDKILMYDLCRPYVAVAPRETRLAEHHECTRRQTRVPKFLLGMLAAIERSPLMGVYVARTSARD